jgi:hypothetical protein
MKKLVLISLGVVSLLLAAGCQPKVDVEKEKAEILKIYNIQMQALLKSDVNAILAIIPEGHVSINIDRGKITKLSKDDTRKGFESQFKQGRFTEVTETVPPTIKISPDGKMAWLVGQMKFKYAIKDLKGVKQEIEATDAWISVYEKIDSKWVENVIAQTFEKVE